MVASPSPERPTAPALPVRPLYTRQVLQAFGAGTVGPFLTVYAISLGASPLELGLLQAILNLAPNVFQLPWGAISDRTGRRLPYLVAGGLFSSIIWVPVAFVHSTPELLALIAVQAVIGSMAIPAWTALIGDVVPPTARGNLTAALNMWAGVGSLLATMVAGYLLFANLRLLDNQFLLAFVLAAVFGVAAVLPLLRLGERARPNPRAGGQWLGIREVVRQLPHTQHYTRFLAVTMFVGFFMAVSWPLFSLTLVRVLHASFLEIAIASVVSTLATIAFRRWSGEIVDRVGRRPILVLYRFTLVTVPLYYGFSPNILVIYLASIAVGAVVAFGDTALTAYLLDASPGEQRGAFVAFFNLATGTVFFLGSFVGGYLTGVLQEALGLVLALQVAYLISAVGRAAGATTYLTLREPFKYPSTLRAELARLIHGNRRETGRA